MMRKGFIKPLACFLAATLAFGSLAAGSHWEVKANEKVLPFDTAAGGGQYATGGRGYDTYVVTSLADYKKGDTPIKGTFRYGLEEVAKQNGGVTIVFNVGGLIELQSDLKFKDIKNVTIAGQTAPGDGITFSGYQTDISNSENIIIRYIRFRPGAVNVNNGSDSMDALWGRDNKNFMIDHCSFSWNTDETLSTYRGQDGTVQYCLIYESLTVSGHTKGRHGYGGIFGGDNVLFQYNLIADTTSRAPRMGGGSMGDPTKEAAGDAYQYCATTQVSNNLIYNYGFNVIHGGGWQYTNYMNNYMMAGPGTREDILDIIAKPGESKKTGGFYIAGNVLYNGSVKNEAISANNLGNGTTSGVINTAPDWTTIADSQYTSTVGGTSFMKTKTCDFPLEGEMETAEESYHTVLSQAGATYPRRDAHDARVVQEIQENNGRFINTENEVGGYTVASSSRPKDFDSDLDGMPDAYEDMYSFNKYDASDAKAIAANGRSNVENYFNSIVDASKEADNPEIHLSLRNNAQFSVGDVISVQADAKANNGGSIAKVEFYNGSSLIGTADKAPYTIELSGLEDGSYYISARAYDNNGTAAQSTASQIHINSFAGAGSYYSEDIGSPAITGGASVENGILRVKGTGKLGDSEGSVSGAYADASKDSFHYVYKEYNGDMTFIAKLEDFTAIDNHSFSGLMIRESNAPNAKTVALGLSLVKQNTKLNEGDPEQADTTWAIYMATRGADEILADTGEKLELPAAGNLTSLGEELDTKASALKAGIPLVEDFYFRTIADGKSVTNGVWLKLERSGDEFRAFAKNEETDDWKFIGAAQVPMDAFVLAGFAVDSNKVANKLDNLSTADFSNISFTLGTPEDFELPKAAADESYIVQDGDTLSKLAKQFECTVEDIKAANEQITDTNFIRAGWVLTIPK